MRRIALALLAALAASPAAALPIEPVGAAVHDNPLYVTTEPVSVLGYTVPVGFITDLASIPAIVQERFAIDPGGPWWRAAILHDWLYTKGIVSRAEADRLFLEAMEADGVLPRARIPMWLTVRLFGGNAWRQGLGWNP